MYNNIVIASDSTCDLNPDLIAQHGIKIIPLKVNLDGKEYLNGVDITQDFIYQKYNEKKILPKTSAVNISEFSEFFTEQTEQGNAVILFTISSQMSGTYNNARLAALDFEDVYVVDSKNLSTGVGLLALYACEMRNDGLSANEIADKCSELTDYLDVSFVIDNLEFLQKGGRCSALAALGANVLKLKPVIKVKDGKMGVSKKYRGQFEAVLEKYISEQLDDISDIDTRHIFVTHAGCDKEIYAKCVELIDCLDVFENIHITRAGCTISSHCGKDTLGILFIRKNPIFDN